MDIIEFDTKYSEDVKDLLVELQEYIVSIDKYGLNTITKDYRDQYYTKTLNEVYDNQGKIYLALQDNNIVGMVAGYIYPYSKEDILDYTCPTKGIVSELIISKKCRSKGFGKLLLEHIERYLKTLGCQYIQIDVFAYNQSAEQFYKKHNYENRMITMFKKI